MVKMTEIMKSMMLSVVMPSPIPITVDKSADSSGGDDDDSDNSDDGDDSSGDKSPQSQLLPLEHSAPYVVVAFG